MAQQVGTLLWEIRTATGLSLGKLAHKAGVSKAALSQWETDKRQPRVTELEAVLEAMGATAAQCAQVFACIEAPRALRHLRQTLSDPAIGPMPTRSDLLRAMRLRKGWTQDQAAAFLNVDRTTVVRWEQGERNPSHEQMHAWCFILDATEGELVALTTGQGIAASEVTASLTLKEKAVWIEQRLDHLFWQSAEGKTGLKDLEFLILEREAWVLAVQDDTVLPLLARLYAYHAESLQNEQRWSEASPLAQRALALVPRQAEEPDFILRAAIVSAFVAVHVGHHPSPERGIHLLRGWVKRSTLPEYIAWMQSDISKFLMQAGQVESALELARQARLQADESHNPAEPYLRQMDHVRLLLHAGHAHIALEQLPPPLLMEPSQYASDLIVHAEAHLQAGERSKAHDWLLQVQRLIEAHSLNHLRAQVENLARQF